MILFIILLTGCTNHKEIKSRIDYFSGVKIPAEAEILYSYIDTSFGAQGHGAQYSVFSFKEVDEDFFTSEYSYGGQHYWTSPEGVKHFRETFSGVLSFAEGRLTENQESDVDHLVWQKDIPSKYAPSWDKKYIYYVENLTIMVYFEESKTLTYIYLGY
jgi:hypothetical protein